jgi:hypothetical protein
MLCVFGGRYLSKEKKKKTAEGPRSADIFFLVFLLLPFSETLIKIYILPRLLPACDPGHHPIGKSPDLHGSMNIIWHNFYRGGTNECNSLKALLNSQQRFCPTPP